jgi:hypothetical protein
MDRLKINTFHTNWKHVCQSNRGYHIGKKAKDLGTVGIFTHIYPIGKYRHFVSSHVIKGHAVFGHVSTYDQTVIVSIIFVGHFILTTFHCLLLLEKIKIRSNYLKGWVLRCTYTVKSNDGSSFFEWHLSVFHYFL